MSNKLVRIKKTAVFIVLFTLAAHGYRMGNLLFSHDALMISQKDAVWQISLGRFLMPVIGILRGSLVAPHLVLLGAMLWMSLSALCILDLFEIQDTVRIAGIAGIIVCNPTVIYANASYIPWLDIYMLALFAGVFSVWIIWKKTGIWTCLLSAAGITVCLGLYQAYICVPIALTLMLLSGRLSSGEELKILLRKGAETVMLLFLSAGAYYAGWRVSMHLAGTTPADSYNGISNVGDWSDVSFLKSIGLAYRNFFTYFTEPDTIVHFYDPIYNVLRYLMIASNLFLLGYTAVRVFLLQKEKGRKVLQALLLLLFPLGADFVCVLSKGMVYILMMYAFSLTYIWYLTLAPKPPGEEHAAVSGAEPQRGSRRVRYILLLLPIIIFFWNNIVFANQIYLKKGLQEQATLSMMTRVIDRVEQTEGYVPGSTQVVFAGKVWFSDTIAGIPGTEKINGIGMGRSAITNESALTEYLPYILGENIRLISKDAVDDPAVWAVIDEMPVYPAEGSVGYAGEYLVVKFPG